MKQCYITFLLTVLMSMVGAKTFALSSYDAKVDGIYYNFYGTRAMVTYFDSYASNSNAYTGNVVIPESVTYKGETYSVTSIGEKAFQSCSGLTSVTIPNSVTSIGASAFLYCKGLTSVTIGNSVTEIGEGAFYGCTSLTSVTIPNSVTSIGNQAFYSCKGLTSVEIGNSVTSIGEKAFYDCCGLTSVTIPNSVTSIGGDAFQYCKGTLNVNCNILGAWFQGSLFSEVIFGNDVTTIGKYAFSGCSSIIKLSLPASLESIDEGVFHNCYCLRSVEIPNSVTSIGYRAFYGCSGLTSVTIPNSVTSIGNYAFYGCSRLKSVTIPNSVTSIGDYAFHDCSGLESVTMGTGLLSIGSKVFEDANPAKVIWLTNTPPDGYSNAAGMVNYVANDLYTSLYNKAVYPFLSSMFEVDGVKYVPVSPSERTCDAIDCLYDESTENIHIGETVTNKGVTLTVKQVHSYAFYKNQHIKDVDLSFNGEIGSHVFSDCYSMETATLGENITSIGTYAFSGCSSLKGIVIPNAVETLGKYAFQNCRRMATVAMGTGVKSIETSTFSNCSALTDMQIGSNVATINESAFSGCKSLPAINIPKAVTVIKNEVFYGCTGLKTVVIEDRETVLNLGYNDYQKPLFSNCPLETVYIGGNINYPTSSSSGYSPFYRNTTLRDVTITDKETEISENEFYGCTSLKNVTIGDGVETIGNWAFSGCSSLDYFAFGSALKNIGKEAFSDCTAVTKIISKAKTPPVCDTQALDDINKWNCVLSVPQGTLSAYQAADQWKEFFFVEEHETGEDPVTITANDLTMVYGDNVPALTYKSEGAELEGTPSLSCEATSKSPVGTYPIVVSQGSVTNGNVTYVNGTLTITKAPLTIKAGNYTMVQGEELPAFTATYEGFKNGETESVLSKKPTFSTTVNASTAPGEYDLNVSGAEAQNYEFTYVPGKITVVAAEPIVITADNKTISYGQTIPELTYSVSGGELKGTPEIYCEATSSSPVGTYPIVITKGSVTNGNVTYVNGTLTITKAPLTIKAGDYTMVQGEELPAFTATYEGFKNGETESVLTTKPTLTTSATSSSDPGTYDVVVSGAKAQNYEISYVNGTLTITASSGISSLAQDGLYNVYDLTGRKIYQNQAELPKLPKGVYIVNGRKVVIK